MGKFIPKDTNKRSMISKNLSKVQKKNAKKKVKPHNIANFIENTDMKLKVAKNHNKSREVCEDDFSSLWKNIKTHFHLVVRTGQDWQSQLIEEKEAKAIPLSIRHKLKAHAQSLYFGELNSYKKVAAKKNNYSQDNMRKVILTHGTTRDKIAALALQCMESPVHTLQSFDNLISYLHPKGKGQYSEIIDHVMNLTDTTYLANNYVAKEFECHNFSQLAPIVASQQEQVEKQLVIWYFEDQFCFSYKNLIKNLEMLANDTVQKIKTLALKALLNLISNHPHQMAEDILGKLVNKLGDSAQNVCNYVQRGLTALIRKNSFLKLTVLSFVEELLYRPNVSQRAQYFALSFLKEFIFRDGDEKLAQRLIKLYMGFFKSCSKSGEVESRFMSVLLRGIHRAYPYAKKVGGSQVLEEQRDTLYKLCHLVNFNISTQALQLIYQVQEQSSPEISNRFYQVVYNQILDPAFGSSTSCSAFLNLVFKVMCKDYEVQRVRAYAKRLLQVAKFQPTQNICGILFLLSEAIKDNSKLGSLKALFAAEAIPPSTVKKESLSDDEEEYYSDLDADEEGNILNNGKSSKKNDVQSKEVAPSWVHKSNASTASLSLKTEHYDPSIRNPLFCGAQLTCLWELVDLQNHYHPTVSLFASRILEEIFVEYSGDPLEDFTLMKFLERFIHRNPKKQKEDKGQSLYSTSKKPVGAKRFNVDSWQFSSLEESKVPVDDLFFYKYFTSYGKKEKQATDNDDTESIDDDDFEEILRKKSFGHFVDPGLSEMDEIDFKKFASKVKDGDFEYDDEGEEEAEEDQEEDFEEGNETQDEVFEDDFANEDSDEGNESSDSDDSDDDNLDKDLKAFKARVSDASDDEDFSDNFDHFEDGEDEFDDSDESVEESPKNKKKIKNKKKFDFDDDLDGLIADPDDYAHLLGASYSKSSGTSEDIFVKDKSGAKQLAWEEKRYGTSKSGPHRQQKKRFSKPSKKFKSRR